MTNNRYAILKSVTGTSLNEIIQGTHILDENSTYGEREAYAGGVNLDYEIRVCGYVSENRLNVVSAYFGASPISITYCWAWYNVTSPSSSTSGSFSLELSNTDTRYPEFYYNDSESWNYSSATDTFIPIYESLDKCLESIYVNSGGPQTIPVQFPLGSTFLQDSFKILVTTFLTWDGSDTYFLRRGTQADYNKIRRWYVSKVSGEGPIWAIFCRITNEPSGYPYITVFYSPKSFQVHMWTIRESDGDREDFYYDSGSVSYNGCTLQGLTSGWGDYNISYTYENAPVMTFEEGTTRTSLFCGYLFGPVDE